MKTDPEPDFEMPMMIDYINDPPHTNNAIRSAYRGGGFYSGFVIDCDGTVLLAHAWAWFARGKEWWNLPLAPIENLHAYLDAYLADPPPCYDNPGIGPPEAGPPGARDAGQAGPPTEEPSGPGASGGGSSGCAVSGAPVAWPLGPLALLGLAAALKRRRRGRTAP